jgi:hypothetical protein
MVASYRVGVRIIDGELAARGETVYRRARSGGGTETARLRVHRLLVDRVPDGCDAVLVTGDLQGVAPSPWGGEAVLLGIALADFLGVWAQEGLLPPPERVGVVLAGDLYSAPSADWRGATGEVRDVWLAFAAAGCPFVLGVAGNHDRVTIEDLADLGPDVVLLDGTCVERGGVLFRVTAVVGWLPRRGRVFVVRMHKVRQWYPSEGRHKVIYRGRTSKAPPTNPCWAGKHLRYWHADVVVLPPRASDQALRATVDMLLRKPGQFIDGVWVWDVTALTH